MRKVHVTHTIKAPIEKVFAVLADHEGYKSFPGVSGARLLKEGRGDCNGLGAVRRIEAGFNWFEEEITRFEPPFRYDYLILRSRPPLRHQGGSVQLKATPEGTQVDWTSSAELRLPLIGALFDGFLDGQLSKAFSHMLHSVDQRLGAKA